MKKQLLTLSLVALSVSALAFAQEADPVPATKKAVAPEATATLPTTPKAEGVSVTQKGRGTLLVGDASWDFGYVAQGARVTHEFVLQNTGEDTLFIEHVKPTCGCTSAPLTKDRLAPGERVPVEVTFNTGKFSGPVHKTVTVTSSDAANTNMALQFSAIVGSMPPTIGLTPETGVAFDRFASDETREARVELTNFSPSAVAVSIVGPPASFLEARLSGDHLEPRQKAELIVRTREGEAPLGNFTGAITLLVSGEQNSRLTIPVTGVSMMK